MDETDTSRGERPIRREGVRRRMSFRTRCLTGGAAVGLAGLLVIAAVLRPSPTGLGTHQQLGLPPCTFRAMFGSRCPTCGMTTAWSNVM
ncbi:MAG: DUF2752 domain-containing protein, partial [Planctomycetota bacterium]